MRREAFRLGVVLLVVVAGLCACGDVGAPESIVHRRPNFVVVAVGDLAQTTTPYWDAMPKTKALIADEGATFRNAFATDPEAGPARATLLTGMYPHNTKVYDATTGQAAFRASADKRSIAVRLKASGYTTAYMGEYLDGYSLDPSRVPPGWDEWFGLAGRRLATGFDYEVNHNGRMEKFGHDEADYQTDVLAQNATDFVADLTRTDSHEPFLLTLSPTAPRAPIAPAPRDADNDFTDAPLPARRNLDEAVVADKPTWLRESFPRLSRADERNATAGYRRGLGSLLAIDDMVDSIADQLRSAGELEDTVFVFTSTNGFSFGLHRIIGKAAPYEEVARVPLAIAGPDIDHGAPDQLVAAVDIAPTLYDLAGMTVPTDVDGRSLVPLVDAKRPPWRDDLLVEHRVSPDVALHTSLDVLRHVARPGTGPKLVPDYRALRTDDWLYVEWYSGTGHEYELYDMHRDPFQLTNLMADPAYAFTHAKTVSTLQQRLAALTLCKGATCR